MYKKELINNYNINYKELGTYIYLNITEEYKMC